MKLVRRYASLMGSKRCSLAMNLALTDLNLLKIDRRAFGGRGLEVHVVSKRGTGDPSSSLVRHDRWCRGCGPTAPFVMAAGGVCGVQGLGDVVVICTSVTAVP